MRMKGHLLFRSRARGSSIARAVTFRVGACTPPFCTTNSCGLAVVVWLTTALRAFGLVQTGGTSSDPSQIQC